MVTLMLPATWALVPAKSKRMRPRDLIKDREHHCRAIASKGLAQSPLAEAAGGDLREIVAPALLRHANIEQNEIEQILLQLPPAKQLHDRQAQALLIDFRHAPRHAARNHA